MGEMQKAVRGRAGALCMAVAGFGLYRLYISIYFLISNVLPTVYFVNGVSQYDIYGLLLTVFVLAFALGDVDRMVAGRRVTVAGVCCMSLGASLFLLQGEVSAWLYAALSSLGVAILTVRWGVALARMGRGRGMLTILGGFAVAALLNMGVGSLITVYSAIGIVCGPLSAALLFGAERALGEIAADEEGGGVPAVGTTNPKYVVKACAAFCIFAVASVFCSFPTEFLVIDASSDSHIVLPVLRALVTAVLCAAAVLLLLLPRAPLQAMYRLVPLCLIVSGTSILLHHAMPLVAYTLALFGRLGFQIVFWLFAPLIACRSTGSTARCFALQFALYWLGYVGSLFVARSMWSERAVGASEAMSALVLASIAVMLLAYLFVFSEHDLYRATLMRLAVPGERMTMSQAIECVADEYDLSPREREVFGLLARGRDTAYIQQALGISAGTVSSHRQRIYRKLEVNSRGELLDIVEAQLGE